MVIALWRRGVYNKDKTGTEIKTERIRVYELDGTRFDNNITDGVTAHDWTLVLQSDTPKANYILAGDMIIYKDHRYTVQNTARKKTRTGYNSFDTVLYLK